MSSVTEVTEVCCLGPHAPPLQRDTLNLHMFYKVKEDHRHLAKASYFFLTLFHWPVQGW